jgi:predicted ABC-type sugar transport system permease subunit
VFGFLAMPDFKKVIVPTPGNLNDQFLTNIDVIDTETYQVTQVESNGLSFVMSYSPSEVAIATVEVGFVLGATADAAATAAGTLADTGVMAVSTTLLLGLFFGSLAFIYVDYRKHKKPLTAIDPYVNYTFMHHVKVVSIPMFRYRLRFSVEKVRR